MGGLNRKNNRDDIVGVFIREKVWLKNSQSQSEAGGGEGEGACPSREHGESLKSRIFFSFVARNKGSLF